MKNKTILTIKKIKNKAIRNISLKLYYKKYLKRHDIIYIEQYFNKNNCSNNDKINFILSLKMMNIKYNDLSNYLEPISKEINRINWIKYDTNYQRIINEYKRTCPFMFEDNKMDNDSYKDNLNNYHNSRLNLIEVSIDNLLYKLSISSQENILIDKNINNMPSDDLICFKLSFEDYYCNKWIYYNTLKLFKYYSPDNNYYYVMMNSNTFYEKSYLFKLYFRETLKYYKNNSNTYFKGGTINQIKRKNIRDKYKPYSLYKKNNIFSDIENIIINLNKDFLNDINSLLDISVIKKLKNLDSDLNITIEDKYKNKLIQNCINYLECSFKLFKKNTLVDYTNDYGYFNNLFNQLTELLIELDNLKINEDNYKHYSIYNVYDLNYNNNLKKQTNEIKVIDNYYIVDQEYDNYNNNYIELGLIYKQK